MFRNLKKGLRAYQSEPDGREAEMGWQGQEAEMMG